MFFLSPPVKVPRTEKSSTASVLTDPGAASCCELVPIDAMSGMGRRRCWLMDENRNFIKIWNYASLSKLNGTVPIVAKLPFSAYCSAETTIFASEICDECDHLAFCTDAGFVSSMDHSIEFQLLDISSSDNRVSSFTCSRRSERKGVLLTALGTTDGHLIVDAKQNGCHATQELWLGDTNTNRANKASEKGWWSSVKSLVQPEDKGKKVIPNEKNACHAAVVRQHALQLIAVVKGAVHLIDIHLDDTMKLKLNISWSFSAPSELERDGVVLSVGEQQSKICALFLSSESLFLITLDNSGHMLNCTLLRVPQNFVECAKQTPSDKIKIFVVGERGDVLVCLRHFAVHVSTCCIEVRHPSSSEQLVCFPQLTNGLTSVMLENGTVVSLACDGPHITLQNALDSNGNVSLTDAAQISNPRFVGSGDIQKNVDIDRYVEELVTAVRVDPTLSLDDAVLAASESFYSSSTRSGSGNWAMTDFNAETENVILRVTSRLKRIQQSHRRFLMAIVQKPQVCDNLRPETLGYLFSAQEALLVLLSLRALQNVGFIPGSDLTAFSAIDTNIPFGRVESQGTLSLVQSHSQLLECQELLRCIVIEVAAKHRSQECTATSIELVFSHPLFCAELLFRVSQHLEEVIRNAMMTKEQKLAVAHACSCIFVVAAQTVIESRESIAQQYVLPSGVTHCLWTNSHLSDELSVKNAFPRLCSLLVSCWSTRCTTANGSAVDKTQKDLLELLYFLLFFSFGCHSRGDDPNFYSRMLRSTLLGSPFVDGKLGYPYGAPRGGSQCPSTGLRAIELAETLALTFDVFDVLCDFSLAVSVSDPPKEAAAYALYTTYCKRNARFFSFSLNELLRQQRDWELLCLPSLVVGELPYAAAERDKFLEDFAPHLLWIASPQRFDALLQDGVTRQPPVSYGPDQLAHQSRCVSVAHLAYLAAGSPASVYSSDLELSAAIVRAQRKFCSPSGDDCALGPQEVVQRLLSIPDSVDAWLEAAIVASLTKDAIAEDLLSQILRQCKLWDGEKILQAFNDEASENEISKRLLETACGRLIHNCRPLQSLSFLQRLGQTVMSRDELRLLCSFVDALWYRGRMPVK